MRILFFAKIYPANLSPIRFSLPCLIINLMTRPSPKTLSILTLLRVDAQRLFERIKYRRPEYMQIFSAKRTRDHFGRIFQNRYESTQVSDLKHCSPEVIVELDRFYTKIDDLRWYLETTEDMPATLDENLNHSLVELEPIFETLKLYIKGELEGGR